MSGYSPKISFSDLSAEKSLSVKLLSAEMRMRGEVDGGIYETLGSAIARLEGSVSGGVEPGRGAYTDRGVERLVRTANLRRWNVSCALGEGQLVPFAGLPPSSPLRFGDLLVAKDGPVGESAVVAERNSSATISSGLLRVRVRRGQFFLAAILKFGPFAADVDAITPTGSTIKHAGKSRILSAVVPRWDVGDAKQMQIALMMKILVAAEMTQMARSDAAFALFLSAVGLSSGESLPRRGSVRFRDLSSSSRLDARFHLAMGSRIAVAFRENEAASLQDLVDSGVLRRSRGQNLQESAIGVSVKHNEPRPGSYRLIEPGFINEDMSVSRTRHLTAYKVLRNLPNDAVIVSAEGSVGRVTVFRKVSSERVVSNIHAFVFENVHGNHECEHAWLATCLLGLRRVGWLDAVSVGGQGGSLAAHYHGAVPIPNAGTAVKEEARRLLIESGELTGGEDFESMTNHELREVIASTLRASHAVAGNIRLKVSEILPGLIARYYPDLKIR